MNVAIWECDTTPSICMFSDVDSCSDMVSRFICNKHSSEICRLVYKQIKTIDGLNSTNSQIVTYATTTASFHLPLFLTNNVSNNANGVLPTVDIQAIRDYVEAIGTEMPQNKKVAILECLCREMDISICRNIRTTTWLDNDSSLIFFKASDCGGNAGFIKAKDLSTFHKKILAYMPPNITKFNDNESIVGVENVTLFYNREGKFFFGHNLPKLVLKYIPQVSYGQNTMLVATPLILAAMRENKRDQVVKSMRQISDNGGMSINMC